MNILILIHNQANTGPYAKVLEMCQALTSLGNDVTLLCTSKQSKLKPRIVKSNGVLVIESPDLLWGKLRQGIDVWNILNRLIFVTKNNYDIAHAIDCRPNVIIPALYLKYVRKVPLVLSWWDLYGEGGTALERSGKFYYAIAGRIESFLETVFRKHADLSIVVSSYLRKKLIDLGYPTENILLMPIGCQSNISCIKERSDARKTLGFDHSTDIFICAGSLFEQDLSLLIYSLRELKLQIKKKMPLTILIGSHSVSPAIAHELNIVVKPRIESRKEFLMHLFAADFGLLPMRCSTANKARWPSKSSDYWSVRLPVISTPINDFEDLFPIHKLGFLAQSDSPTHYAATLLFALNSSEKIRSEMESHIEQYLVSELDWNTICRKQMDTLGSLVDLDKTK